MEDLKELEELRKAALNVAQEARAEAEQLDIKIKHIKANNWLSENGFSIGDDFMLKGNKKRRLTNVAFWLGRPTPVFTIYRKDGSLGTRTEEYLTELTEYTKI